MRVDFSGFPETPGARWRCPTYIRIRAEFARVRVQGTIGNVGGGGGSRRLRDWAIRLPAYPPTRSG